MASSAAHCSTTPSVYYSLPRRLQPAGFPASATAPRDTWAASPGSTIALLQHYDRLPARLGSWKGPRCSDLANVLTNHPSRQLAFAVRVDTQQDIVFVIGRGEAAGTIAVSGTVSAGSLTFGAASGAITLSGGTITLPSTETKQKPDTTPQEGSVK